MSLFRFNEGGEVERMHCGIQDQERVENGYGMDCSYRWNEPSLHVGKIREIDYGE